MIINPRPGDVVAEPTPLPRPTVDTDAAKAVILAKARLDPGAAVLSLNRVLFDAFLVFDGLGRSNLSSWSIPDPHASEILRGRFDSGRLIIEGRQRLRDLGNTGASALVIVRDRNPGEGGYIARVAAEAIVVGEPVFGREGFRERFVDASSGVDVAAFQALDKPAFDALLAAVSILEDFLHAVVDFGLLKDFSEIAHEHITTRTRPWQGQSLAKATDDPHLVRRYGEFQTTLGALGVLVDEAAAALKAADPERQIDAVSAARAYASLAGQSVINGTLELLGAGATSQRYGFDRYWSDFTAHAITHPPLNPFEVIGRAFVSARSGE